MLHLMLWLRVDDVPEPVLHVLRALLAHGVPVGHRGTGERRGTDHQHVGLAHVELAERLRRLRRLRRLLRLLRLPAAHRVRRGAVRGRVEVGGGSGRGRGRRRRGGRPVDPVGDDAMPRWRRKRRLLLMLLLLLLLLLWCCCGAVHDGGASSEISHLCVCVLGVFTPFLSFFFFFQDALEILYTPNLLSKTLLLPATFPLTCFHLLSLLPLSPIPCLLA